MRVVATAGHVDHGKSTLIRELTGTDPDRFPEEKARGLTIDLGFAFVDLPFPDGTGGTGGTGGTTDTVGFVDVPGHVRFVKNMLAGVGAVETALLVVAANEGWMPQTEEHVRILELLGIAHGLVVVTKADTVDEETLELAQLDVAEHVTGRVLESWPVVVSDAVSGRGLDAVRAALVAVLGAAPGARDEHRARLWVDRSFAARGAGTVVTGTLALGALAVDDEVVVLPTGARARVRGIEANHERLTRAAPGARVALNLAGVDHHDIARGAAVVAPDLWATPTVFDARVLTLTDVALPRRATLAVHVGSGEWPARWRQLDAGGRYARVRLSTPLPLRPGDRVVLRSTGRRLTVGGAEVLDVAPARRTAIALERLPRPPIERASAAQPFAPTRDLVRAAGLDPATAAATLEAAGLVTLAGRWTSPARLDDLRDAARRHVREHHRAKPDEPGIDLATLAARIGVDAARVRALLAGDRTLVVDQETVRHHEHAGRASATPAGRALVEALEGAPFAPPAPGDVGADARLVRLLIREGKLVELDGVVFAASALEAARALVVEALHERGTLTVAAARDVLGSTRKFVLPILERLDHEGVTRRNGDERVLRRTT